MVCGDSSLSVLDAATGGKNPDLVYTDPPYGIDIVISSRKRRGQKKLIMALIIGTRNSVGCGSKLFSFDSKVLIWGGNHFATSFHQVERG